MKMRQDPLHLKQRIGFFDYIFDRAANVQKMHKSRAVMVFLKPEKPHSVTTNSLYTDRRSTHVQTQHHHTTNTIYPTMQLRSSKHFMYNDTHAITYHTTNRYDTRRIKLVSVDNSVNRTLYNRRESSVGAMQPLQYRKGEQEQRSGEGSVEQKFSAPAVQQSVMLYHKQHTTDTTQKIHELEERVVSRVVEKMNVERHTQHTHTLTKEERIVRQQEERRFSDRVYASVMKQWDRELKRRGHLYG
jgi:hypothetical protein